MSQRLLDKDGLTIDRWIAEERPNDGDRRRYTISTTRGRQVADLSAEQWLDLADFFGWDCSPDCEGPHICTAWCRHPGKEEA